MNMRRVFLVSFMVLLLSTSQSSFIISLLMKIMLLKGALFMTMPLSLGAFMMGQGMGFFSGNMLGAYMMLRAANRYHKKEKKKWTGNTGWKQQFRKDPAYSQGYAKGQAFIAALKGTKHKIKAFNYALQGVNIGLQGFKDSVLKHSQKKRRPNKKPNQGWGWTRQEYSKPYKNQGFFHHHNPHVPYGPPPFQNGGWTNRYETSVPPVSYGSPASSWVPGTAHHGGYNNRIPELGFTEAHHSRPVLAQETYIERPDNPANIAPLPSYHSGTSLYQSYSSVPFTMETYQNQPPDEYRTVFTAPILPMTPGGDQIRRASVSPVPGAKFTGLLTQNGKVLNDSFEIVPAESSDMYFRDEDNVLKSMKAYDAIKNGPNPVVENFLESKLEQEAKLGKDEEQKKEALELIKLLRKAYLQQLLESLKKEEHPPKKSSAENKETLRSIERSDNFDSVDENLVRVLLGSKEENTTPKMKVTQIHSVSSTPGPLSNVELPSDTLKVSMLPEPGEDDSLWEKTDTVFVEDEDEPFVVRVKRQLFPQEMASSTAATTDGPTFAPTLSPDEAQEKIDSFRDDLKKFFTLLSVLDNDMCLQKLVCDVHAKPEADWKKLTQYELNIITTFKLMKSMVPASTEEDSTTKYRRAALIGEIGNSPELCGKTYAACQYTSSQIVTLGTQSNANGTDWDVAESVVKFDKIKNTTPGPVKVDREAVRRAMYLSRTAPTQNSRIQRSFFWSLFH